MSVLERPLTARSVLASTLLGTDPPCLPASFLVRTGELFGLSEGAVRTALSRMAAAGDVRRDDLGRYVLQGDLITRQSRQRQSRVALTNDWNGRWSMAIVASGTRPASERASLRSAMKRLHMAELREGVWLRPDNLNPERLPAERQLLEAQCLRFDSVPRVGLDDGEVKMAGRLWDLAGWSDTTTYLRRRMHESSGQLQSGDPDALADGFVLSAAILRHLGADPLLPRELAPRNWPGARLRAEYDEFDRLYREVLSRWVAEAALTPEAGGELRSLT